MPSNAELAASITTALALGTPAVAVTFADGPAPEAGAPATPVAAGCKFWELGASQALRTTADDHRHCAIGIHTHNLADAPASQASELGAVLAAMQGLDYVRAEEVAALPVLDSSPRTVGYEPLSSAGVTPALVLLFTNAAQSLVVTEAVARVDGATPLAMGRPACALLPQVSNTGRATSSLGCCGARAYLDNFGDDITLWCLPGDKLAAYAEAMEVLGKANDVLMRFHQQRRADIENGGSPSVEQSLARLG